MHNFVIEKDYSSNALKIVYKLLSVYLCLCLCSFLFFGIYNFYIKKYVFPLKYKEFVYEYADYYGFERAFIFAVIKTESGFDEKAISKAGAIGLMQITEKTGEYIAKRLRINSYDLKDTRTNVQFGCYYIKYLYEKFNNMQTAMIAYNAGEGNVFSWLEDKNYSKDGKTLYRIPFVESREYIAKINKNFEKYKKLYKNILDK